MIANDRPSSVLDLPRFVAVSAVAAAVSFFAAGMPMAAAAQTVEDSGAIHARIEAYLSAWNAHDPSNLAAFFSEDADMVIGNQPAARGRPEIRQWWQDYFTRQEPERRLTLDVSPVRFVAPGVAVITVTTTTGGRSRGDQELPARRFRGTWLWRRQSGNWLIAAMRGLPRQEDRVVLNATRETAEALRPDIRAFVAAYQDAFNTHKPAAVTAFYRDDAEIIVRNSPWVQGREAIQNWWRSYFSQPRPYQAILIIDEIRRIAPDVALINLTGTGAVSPKFEDPTLPVRHTRATWVISRDAGKWLISALWVLPSEEDDIVRGSGGSN